PRRRDPICSRSSCWRGSPRQPIPTARPRTRGGGGAPEGTGVGGAGGTAIEGLIGSLECTGFARVRTEDHVIDLHSCPLREFLSTHGHLVCSIHRGLMAGYLDAAQSPRTVDPLEPFSTASSCRTRLRQRTNGDEPRTDHWQPSSKE